MMDDTDVVLSKIIYEKIRRRRRRNPDLVFNFGAKKFFFSRRFHHRNRLPLCFSWYSTVAYKAPPTRVSKMPTLLAGVIVKSKIMTAHRTVNTCLTLDATVIARGPTLRLALKLTTFRKKAKTPLKPSHIRKLTEAPSEIIDEEGAKRWSCTRLSSPVKWANSIVWINASGDRR